MSNTVSYNGQKIIPAPFVSISKEYIKGGGGDVIGAAFNISLIGKLVVGMGSPSGGGFWTGAGYPPNESVVDPLANLTYKTEQMRNLFAIPGKNLEIQGCAGTAPIKCYPTMKSINFQEGNWFQTIDYNVSLECNEMFGTLPSEDASGVSNFFKSSDGSGLILKEANEEWNIEINDQSAGFVGVPNYPFTYKVNHTVSAAGIKKYDGVGTLNGYEMARKWVNSKLGLDNGIIYGTGSMGIYSYYQPFNYLKTEQTNKINGSFSVVESWIFSSGAATEEFNISVKRSNEDPLVKITIDGSIQGLDSKTQNLKITKTKMENAEDKFTELTTGGYYNPIYYRMINYAKAGNVNIIPTASTIGRNPQAGTITYNYEYDTRPANMIPGSLYESYTIQGTNSTDVFASITVPGRIAGPILQNINTITAPKFGVQIEVLMPMYSGIPDSTANALAMVNSSPRLAVEPMLLNFYNALSASYSIVFKDNDTENWNPRTGRYSRDVSWTYGSC